ncbi:hypothetical protein ES705_37784 [subsurface metagenome]
MAKKSSLSDKEYLTILYETRRYSGEQFDKLIVYLSSGALVLTVGFVEKIIDLSKIDDLSLLYTSWTCFCSSLIIILISHMTSMHSIDFDIHEKEKISTGFNIATHILNWLSMITLLVGIGTFIRFVIIAFSLKGG